MPRSMQYQCVELFSGKGEVSRSFIEAGKKTAYFDWIHDHRAMDIQSPAGMAFFDCIYISKFGGYTEIHLTHQSFFWGDLG